MEQIVLFIFLALEQRILLSNNVHDSRSAVV